MTRRLGHKAQEGEQHEVQGWQHVVESNEGGVKRQGKGKKEHPHQATSQSPLQEPCNRLDTGRSIPPPVASVDEATRNTKGSCGKITIRRAAADVSCCKCRSLTDRNGK